MKNLILTLAIFTGFTIQAQECKYWKNETDDFTGKVKKFTKSVRIAKGSGGDLRVELRRVNETKYLFVVYSGDLGCITSDTELLIKLVNGEVVTLVNFADIDCSSGAPSAFLLSDEDIAILEASEIEKVRITGSEYYADLIATLPVYFMGCLQCIE